MNFVIVKNINMDTNKEFQLLSDYMNIYIQLLTGVYECGGKKIEKRYLPTFQEYKDKLGVKGYCLESPTFRDKLRCIDNKIIKSYMGGIGMSENIIAYRDCNYWMGIKYYTKGNINGNFTSRNS